MKKDKNDMGSYEMSRWIGLILGIDKIYKLCKRNKIDFNKIDLKPIALKAFINSVAPKIEADLDNGALGYKD